MDGKRCLIPPEIGEQILALDNSKIVIDFRDSGPGDDQVHTEASTDIPADTGNSEKAADI